MDFLKRAATEGFWAGLIGAGGVALWFLLVDSINGQPFYTPALLGSALFLGLRDPGLVQIAYSTVIMYSMIHVIAFWLVGTIAAMLAALVDRVPTTLFLVVVFFAIFEVGFYILVATVAQSLLGALAWTNVAIGNLLAAGGMGFYLYRAHPHIREALAAHPLGETDDGE
ncbi:MAG: hypothetical protein ACREMF_00010 [Gemmatimonadales bacterium]